MSARACRRRISRLDIVFLLTAALRGQFDDTHTPLPLPVALRPDTAVGLMLPFGVDNYRVQGFQTASHILNQPVGGGNDVLRAAVVEGQEIGLFYPVILQEAVDVFVARAVEGIDVLVVVADCDNGQFFVFVLTFPSCKCGNQFVMLFGDVLVFVHQNITEASHDAVAGVVAVRIGGESARQHGGSFPAPLFELSFLILFFAVKPHAQKPHRHSVVSQDGNGGGKAADQFEQTPFDFLRGKAVESQDDDGGGVDMFCLQQIGGTVYDDARFA